MNTEVTIDTLKPQVDEAAVAMKTLTQEIKDGNSELRELKRAAKEAAKSVPKATDDNQDAVDAAKAQAQAAETAAEEFEAAHKERKDQLDKGKAWLRDAKAQLAELRKQKKTTPKAERVRQHGQTAPAEGTISADLWAAFDGVAATLGRPPALEEVMEAGKNARDGGVVEGSVKAGYAHWRKFHGITGRVQSAAQIEKAAQKEAEKKAKADAKAAKAAEAAAAAE